VISDEVSENFAALLRLRHRGVHYNRNLDCTDARDVALEAVRLIQGIIEVLFTSHGGPPRFIEGTSGHSFLSLESETQPFIRRFFLPACALVSPRFEMKPVNLADGSRGFEIYDDDSYQEKFPTLTDSEFAEHRTDIQRFWRDRTNLDAVDPQP
jgi:hypothetical protein